MWLLCAEVMVYTVAIVCALTEVERIVGRARVGGVVQTRQGFGEEYSKQQGSKDSLQREGE